MLLIIKEIDLSLRKIIYLTKLILLEIYNNNNNGLYAVMASKYCLTTPKRY
nr:MAG TPA: hypothetical protein [Caudoviricetes sp.]